MNNDLLTLVEVAAVLGVSRYTLYLIRKRGELETILVGQRGLRVTRAELERYLVRKGAG